MPAFRIIPCLDVHAGRVVKGVSFVNLRDVGDPVTLARRYREEGADELVFLDISATVEERAALCAVIGRVAEVLDIPFSVGGGVASVSDATALLMAGADKVAVNSAAVGEPELLTRLAERFGSQCVVLAVDARQRQGTGNRAPGSGPLPPETRFHGSRSKVPGPRSSGWEVVTHGGRRPTGRDAPAWIAEGAARGAGEILLTSMDRDGTGAGFDVELLVAARAAADLPLIASGGGETSDHFIAAARVGADAGLAATIFHEARIGIGTLKRQLAAADISVRLEGS